MVKYVKLTTEIIQKAPYTKGKQFLLRDSVIKGFTVRIGSKTKTYCIHKNFNGKFIAKSIGKFEDISLSDAREKASHLLDDIKGFPSMDHQIRSPEEFIAKMDEGLSNYSSPDEIAHLKNYPKDVLIAKKALNDSKNKITRHNNNFIIYSILFCIIFSCILYLVVFWREYSILFHKLFNWMF